MEKVTKTVSPIKERVHKTVKPNKTISFEKWVKEFKVSSQYERKAAYMN